MKLRLLSDAFWTAAGQAAIAAGMILGIRVLTEFVSPKVFGEVSLSLGVAALAMNVACTPLTQAAIHFFPALAARNAVDSMRDALAHSLTRIGLWSLPLMAVAVTVASINVGGGAALLMTVVAGLLVCDCLRSVELTFLNAGRSHKRYALWAASDACLRPLVAAAAVAMAGEAATTVLAAYLATSMALLWIFRRPGRDATPPLRSPSRDPELDKKLWRYALPLVPLGLMGWANGLGDRYVIGGVLSLADVGVYAAVYGLASRPFLMLSQSIELAMRPVYQSAVSAQRTEEANRLLLVWIGVVSLAGVLGFAAMALWSTQIVDLLLAEQYRRAADLMPWIAAGYCLLALCDVFTRVSYAYGNTRRVLAIAASAALTGVVATLIGAWNWGLVGAAMAVPVYFGVQLAVSMITARASYRQAARNPRREVHG